MDRSLPGSTSLQSGTQRCCRQHFACCRQEQTVTVNEEIVPAPCGAFHEMSALESSGVATMLVGGGGAVTAVSQMSKLNCKNRHKHRSGSPARTVIPVMTRNSTTCARVRGERSANVSISGEADGEAGATDDCEHASGQNSSRSPLEIAVLVIGLLGQHNALWQGAAEAGARIAQLVQTVRKHPRLQ
jgi:hypothetical protein